MIDRFTTRLFGRHKSEGADASTARGWIVAVAVENFGDTEVDDLDLKRFDSFVEQHVGRCEVAMNDPGFVRVLHRVAELAKDPLQGTWPKVNRGLGPDRDLLPKGAAGNELEREVGTRRFEMHTEQFGDVGMVHLLKHPGLALEAGPRGAHGHEPGMELFERDLRVGLEVVGKPDLPGAPDPQLPDELVPVVDHLTRPDLPAGAHRPAIYSRSWPFEA